MAPTYSTGNCTEDGAKEGVTFTVGTAAVLKNAPDTTTSATALTANEPEPATKTKTMTATVTVDMSEKSEELSEADDLLQDQINYSNKGYRRVILLSRHGESENNFSGKIGGDTNLSPRGRNYAAALGNYINSLDFPYPLEVWTSCLKRTIATAANCKCDQRKAMKELNELHAGCCEGLSYEEIQKKYPLEFAMRDQNKLAYKYPNGESYEDVLGRVDSILERIEKSETEDEPKIRLIVSHQAVLRCLLSRFLGISEKELPYIQVPLHTVIWLMQDDSEEWTMSHVRLPVECVDTFRPRPKNCTLRRSESDALETVPTHY